MTVGVEVLASAGAVKYVGGTITEVTGKDISGATYVMSLGSATYPGPTWYAADVSQQGPTTATRIVKLKITSTLPSGIVIPGTYWVWCKITDAPEVEPLRLQGPIVVR
jgi:hypothetical protein